MVGKSSDNPVFFLFVLQFDKRRDGFLGARSYLAKRRADAILANDLVVVIECFDQWADRVFASDPPEGVGGPCLNRPVPERIGERGDSFRGSQSKLPESFGRVPTNAHLLVVEFDDQCGKISTVHDGGFAASRWPT